MAIWTRDTIRLGAELPSISRQWNLDLFTKRHELVYGEGNIVKEAWPEKNIHSDAEAAMREGLSEPVASAPQIFSILHRIMLAAFGEGWVAGGKMAVKMIKPVYPADFTTGKGRVTGLTLEEQADGTTRVRVHCDTWVERRDGTRVMVGTASALLR
ncbi:MAG: MaoC family dehydratase [Planctomycetes bacterium]|nr:MaoC family dehydratase [Planctomycetota bacterium]